MRSLLMWPRRHGSRLGGWLLLVVPGLVMAQPPEIIPPELRGAVQPQAAVAPNGKVYVTFGRGSSVYCSVSTNGGGAFLRPVEVASLPKLALGMRRGPRIVASNNQITISAISHDDGNLYSCTSENGGVSWSKGARINSVTNSAREGLHAMAGDGNGIVYTVWLDLRNKGTQLWGARSDDRGRTWARDVMIYQSPDGHICECCHPSVQVCSDGAVRVMWPNWLGGSRDMYTASSTDGGKTFGTAEKLGGGTWPLGGCPMDGGSLSWPYSTWRRGANVYHSGGGSGEHLLGKGTHPVVGVGKEGAYFVWQIGSQLMLKKGVAVQPVVFAEGATYPAMAVASAQQPPVLVWESLTNGVKTILAEVVR
ncbi:MAG: hypothetical protein JWR69_4521 [Pedosphaera sp.]|nr:hypothetical protein [Pedosphaera sp.]